MSHRRLSALTKEYGKHLKRGNLRTTKDDGKLSRIDTNYFFGDLPVCRKMFLFLNATKIQQFENIVSHYDENGIVYFLTSNSVN